MQLGMIGLGRMGGNIVRRLMKHGHSTVVYDKDPKAVAAVAPRRARDVAGTRSERGENRVEAEHRFAIAADHHAISALETPDAAAGADVDIMDAALLQRLAAAYVVLPERIAAIDDDVAGLHQAVFDAVVDHFDEMPGADRAGVNVAEFDA